MDIRHSAELCPRFHKASELIGSRWTGAIIYMLLKRRCRFAALRAAIPQITDRMLSERLHALELEGIVVRHVLPEAPVRVEYELTKKGRALATAFDAIAHWAEKWVTFDEASAAETPNSVRRARQTSASKRGPGSPQKRTRSASSA